MSNRVRKTKKENSDIRTIEIDEFVRRLKSDECPEKCFSLFLGAGCSVTSGIPDAGTLVREHWIPRLRDFIAPDYSDHEKWAKESIDGYDPRQPSQSYGTLIDKLFLNPEERQREIETLCENATPSFGYAVLAQLIALDGGRFNVVLTTNFDDLLADALYLYTESRPLVINHDSLATYIRPTRTRPLVVKLHGDHRLSPRNTIPETNKLEEAMQNHTAMTLHDRGIIFMGYGGADQGILAMLNSLPPEALPYGAYWVHPHEPQGKIRVWLSKKEGIWVRSGWFDEVMLLVRNEFNLPHPSPKRFEYIFENYHNKFKELSGSISKKSDDESSKGALEKAITDTENSFPDYWKVINEADRYKETDIEKANQLYSQGIEQFPKAAPLLGNYANFLRIDRKDVDAEAMYKRAIEADPKHANNLGNYANFLWIDRKDVDAAEAMYKRAIEADPKHANILGSYANFLRIERKDVDAAEAMYKRAIEADPKHANILGNYANFLWIDRKDVDAAEAMYKRAIEADPKHANSLGSYANFLRIERKDVDAAEAMYKRAIEADPKNANNYANAAGFFLARGNKKGHDYLKNALNNLIEYPYPQAELECSFYLFAHGTDSERKKAIILAKRLIDSGVRSPGWDFSQNIERAKIEKHPDIERLDKLADVITEKAEPEVLNDWSAWNNTKT